MTEPRLPEPPADGKPAVSRRWFVAGGLAAVLGAGGGAAAEMLRSAGRVHRRPVAPAALGSAIRAEQALVADLDATTGGTPAVRRVIVQSRADHAEHLRVLLALRGRYRPAPTSTPSAAAKGTPRTRAELRRAEQAASSAAAQRAAGVDGSLAALFASIAACEATHSELLR